MRKYHAGFLEGCSPVMGSGYSTLPFGSLSGGGGDDQLISQGSTNYIDGGLGTDTLFYNASSSGINVDLNLGLGRGGDAEGDTLVNIENLVASPYEDVLVGNGQDNILETRGGNDRLTGGGGRDTYKITKTAMGGEIQITDFQAGSDLIDLSDFDVSFSQLTNWQINGVLKIAIDAKHTLSLDNIPTSSFSSSFFKFQRPQPSPSSSPSPSPSPLPSPSPSTSPPPSPCYSDWHFATGTQIVLEKLKLSAVGDLDRDNEEIEIEVRTGNYTLNWGTFIYSYARAVKEKALEIRVPCHEEITFRIIERDVCNDDVAAITILCPRENLGTLQTTAVTISPDQTKTSYTQCTSSSKTWEVCGGAGIDFSRGILTLSFNANGCYSYTWGEEECGGVEVSEGDSKYELLYRVVDGNDTVDVPLYLDFGQLCNLDQQVYQ